ncbi:MAG: DUF4012 domain-containing protein [Patescibacteria group bacterium]|nr:DUF4012 domain-containing protein [Patescibacteria group bacterium]
MKKNRLVQVLILILIILLIIGYFFIWRPVKKIEAQGKKVINKGKELKKVFSKNDIDLFEKELKDFYSDYSQLEKEAKSIYWLSFIPYVADFKNGLIAGQHLILAGQKAIEAIVPYADLLGFKKGESSFVEKSAEDRLQTAVLTLDKMIQKIDPISQEIAQAEILIEKIDSKRYPKKIGKREIRGTIDNIKEQFFGLTSLFVEAKPLLKRLPEIFGKDKEKTYLILFQNDKELRATGGFLTSYAVFKIKNGKINIDRSEDIYSLDETIASHPKAPREILTYHKDVYQFNIRDSNLSPDFPTSVELFNSLYKKSGARVDYNGIIALDSKILVDMLEIFGDTEAGGVTFSSKIDKRCDCPQVLYQLFDIVDRPTPYLRENRKGILGDLMFALFYKAIGFSPSKYWGTLIQTMYKNLEEKHILLYFVDKELQKAVEKLNFAGKIRDYDGDYLHINNVNFAGAKSNLFVSQKYLVETKGKEKEITIVFQNPYPHSDCNLERGGLCLNATLRNWIRIYIPKGSKLIKFSGSTKKVEVYEDLGKTVFEGFMTVAPEKTAKVVVNYQLPEKINPKKILIQKQPGTYNDEIIVKVDGKKVFEGVLNIDREIK